MKLSDELKSKMETPINFLEMSFEEIMAKCSIEAEKGNDSVIFKEGSFRPEIIEKLEDEGLYVAYSKDANDMFLDWSETGRRIADLKNSIKVTKLNIENMERMRENDTPWWQFWK